MGALDIVRKEFKIQGKGRTRRKLVPEPIDKDIYLEKDIPTFHCLLQGTLVYSTQ